MAKKTKKSKKEESRFDVTLGSTLKNNWVEISTETIQDAALGAGGGILLEQAFGVGSTGLNVGIGAGAGALAGFARGTGVCLQREKRLASLAEDVLDEMQETYQQVSDRREVADAVREVAKVFVEVMGGRRPKDDEDDEDEDEKPRRGKGKERQASA
jgi:ribulose 1,5-bisphosphate synthetase/thiazole synthase